MSGDTGGTGDTRDEAPHSSALVLTVSTIIGVAAMAYGVWSAFDLGHDTHPFELSRWVIGLDIIHDLVLIPVIGLAAWVLVRFAPASLRRFVRWAALTSGVLCLIAWPFVRGYGRNPHVPSLLQRDYGLGLVVYIVMVWVLAALAAVVSHFRASSDRFV